MTNVIISPSTLKGTVSAPPSKSDVHRAIICAALSQGVCRISPVALSNDIKATIGCIEALGATTKMENNVLTVDGSNIYTNKKADLFCSESGSTLRFFIPVAAAGGINATFSGEGLLPDRPIGIFLNTLPEAGVECITEGGLPLEIKGQLRSGIFEIPGNVSSQFITGLLFALPLLKGDSEIRLTSPLESTGYIDMTIYTMSKFGVEVETTENGWFIRGNQNYKPTDYITDRDWSQAAFFMVAGAISGNVTITGVNKNSAQGDKKIAELLAQFGADVNWEDSQVTVKSEEMKAITIDASQIPDLVPVLAVCATFAKGTTKIINAERLRIKESDRLNTTANLINSLGGKVTELSDGLEITGVSMLKGGNAQGSNDHRIVMSAAVCGCGCENEIDCTDAQSINKSYPDFFEDYNRIGGKANVLLR